MLSPEASSIDWNAAQARLEAVRAERPGEFITLNDVAFADLHQPGTATPPTEASTPESQQHTTPTSSD